MGSIQKPFAEKEVARILEKYYYDVKNPASFGGILKLSKATGLPIGKIKTWLMTQDAYTLHKPVRYKFKRRKVLSYGIGELIECDLTDLSKLSRYNKGMKYLFTAIDVFTKYAWAYPVKNKTADNVSNAFKKLLSQLKTPPHLIHTDRGKEFYNSKVQVLFKKYKIRHYSSQSENKASVVERFHRTLKSKLYRIFTYRNSYKYIDILDSVLKSYNSTKHSSTGLAPVEVTSELEPYVFQKLYGYRKERDFKFSVNDRVRISKAKKLFQRGYLPNWSEEIFIIHDRYPTNPPTYVIKDLKGEILIGRFYEEEIQKVIKESSDYWRIEKILKTRGKGADKEYFVKWFGYDQRFCSWVKESWLKS